MNETAAMQSRVGDTALKIKTGKTWAEWFAVLDKAGAAKMSHTEVAAHLYEKLHCPGWWNQMVAVGYEQARGLREKHQKPDGYEISVSRVVAASAAALFKAWKDPKARRRWLRESITIRKATTGKSMRITWADGKTGLEVNFYSKGSGKSQVVVQHGKLPDSKAAARMKAYWAKTLDGLRKTFEQ